MNYTTHKIVGTCATITTLSVLSHTTSDLPFTYSNNLQSLFSPENIRTLTLCSTAIISSFVGSSLPDIDCPTSKAGSKIKPLSKTINIVSGHRGFFHSPLVWTLLLSLLAIFFIQANNLNYATALIKIILISTLIVILIKHLGKRHQVFLTFSLILLSPYITQTIKFENLSNNDPQLCFYAFIGLSIGVITHLLIDFTTKMGIPVLYPVSKNKVSLNLFETGHEEIFLRIFVILFTISLNSAYLLYPKYFFG